MPKRRCGYASTVWGGSLSNPVMETHISQLEVPPTKDVDQRLDERIELEHGMRVITGLSFCYEPNRRVTELEIVVTSIRRDTPLIDLLSTVMGFL